MANVRVAASYTLKIYGAVTIESSECLHRGNLACLGSLTLELSLPDALMDFAPKGSDLQF